MISRERGIEVGWRKKRRVGGEEEKWSRCERW
jgi:hypothetical protein